MEDLNKTLNQLDLFDIYRALYPTIAKQSSFSPANGTFTPIWKITKMRPREVK